MSVAVPLLPNMPLWSAYGQLDLHLKCLKWFIYAEILTKISISIGLPFFFQLSHKQT